MLSADLGGSPPVILIDPQSNAVLRLGLTGNAIDDQARLQQIFEPDGILRIVDNSDGREQYGIIDNVQVAAGGRPQIQLKNQPGIITKESGTTCGTKTFCVGCLVNPVNIIRYEITDTSSDSNFPQFQYLHEGTAEFDDTRHDLVRYSLPADQPNDAAPLLNQMQEAEMVAEYAVDLRFGVSVNQNTATVPTLNHLDEGDLLLPRFVGDPGTGPAAALGDNGAQLIRGIYARLAIRDKGADRDAPVTASTRPQDLFRVQVAPGRYARLRTLRSHIATRNTQNFTWN